MKIFKLNFFATIAIAVVTSLTSCDTFFIEGYGPVVAEVIDLPYIDGVLLEGNMTVIIEQGSYQYIEVRAQENIIDLISEDVYNGIWRVSLDGYNVTNMEPIYVYITVPNLNFVEVDGSGIVGIDNFYEQRELDLYVYGSGAIELNEFEDLSYLGATVSGSGDITCFEYIECIDIVDITVEGSGIFDGYNVAADNCYVDIQGSGGCNICVHEYLDATISGSGSVNYIGYPTVDKRTSGSGDVYNRN